MKNTIKNLLKLVAGAALLASSQLYAASGVCALGNITEFYAGGWYAEDIIALRQAETPPATIEEKVEPRQ